MGISFKLSKIGKRFRPKSLSPVAAEEEARKDVVNVTSQRKSAPSPTRKLTEKANENKGIAEISDREVSFAVSLFPNGYTVGKPMENESGCQPSIEIPKFLHPYDRASETLFSAIESGYLPGDILEDIPCKYVDGTLVCEVRDYRNCYSESEHSIMASGDGIPVINRVCLRMSLENVVKDIPAISKSGWTYGDLMEVESRVLRALQPQLYLDPTPLLDRLSDNLVTVKLNLALSSMRRKRLRQISEVSVFSADNNHIKKACTDRVPDSTRLGDSGSLVQHPTHENLNTQNNVSSTMLPLRNNCFGSDGPHMGSFLVSNLSKYQIGDVSPRNIKDHRSGALLNSPAASPGEQGMIPFSDNGAASIQRENPDGQSSPLTNKKSKRLHMGMEGNPQHAGAQPDNIHGTDLHWKNTLMQQQSIARGIHYTNNGLQKLSQQVFEGGLFQEGAVIPFSIGQQGLRYGLKEEPVETERLDKLELSRMHMGESESTRIEYQQSRLQQRMPQQLMRSGFPQPPWNNFGQPLENNSRKEDSLQKRKFVQSPRLSAGGLPQSPLSSKSGEFSSGSIGPQFGGVVTSGLISSQKDKSAVTSVPSVGVGVGGNPLLTSSANESTQRQNQAQAAAKRRSNSLPKTPAISGVGSPASVCNMSVPIKASSPPLGNQPLADQIMLERFSKVEMVSMRCQLKRKKNNVDEYPIRKPNAFSSQQLLLQLSSESSNENLNDETCKMPLSKSLVGGNMNVFKTRILNFLQSERVIQGNCVQYVPKARTRMIMSEKPNDAVAYCIGEIEDDEYLDGEDYLPTLPNTHAADLLAAQFCSLMERDGYHIEDHVQPKPVRTNNASINQFNAPGIPPGSSASEMQQFSGAFGQPLNDISKPGNNVNASVNSMQNIQGPRMLPPGNAQALQISQGLTPGVSLPSIPQQPEPPPALQQHPQPQQNSLMQQQHPQFQRSPMILPANSMQHLNNIAQNANMQIGGPMANKPSSLQLQMLQQQQPLQPQQQQQQSQMQRKTMTGLGTVGISNIGNNMVGLGGLGNSGMAIGGVRGVAGTGISTPMGSISNVGSMNQNPMNLSQASNISNAMHSGTITQAQAAFLKMKMAQNRSNILGSPQSSIGGIPGARQIHPGSTGLSMLGPTLNRANINQMQRTAMGAMGPPKLMSGMNLYMNQQQQLRILQQQHQQQQQIQLQHQQLQLQQQQLQQQQLQLQQETTSPLRAVVSPPPVGSPSSMGLPIQMTQPQQQQPQQQTSPQQISLRTPMSPQLSSGAIHPMSTANPEACPASPQVSLQTLGSVGSITNSPMELQGVHKSNSVNNA